MHILDAAATLNVFDAVAVGHSKVSNDNFEPFEGAWYSTAPGHYALVTRHPHFVKTMKPWPSEDGSDIPTHR